MPASDDELILVDADDRIVGHASVRLCHDGEGRLHRAFSIFIFSDAGDLLIQQRAATKRLWPLYWSNSCCSHPRRGEAMADAAARRLDEELGLRVPLTYLYKFQYQARFDASGSENELCSVFVGRARGEVRADPAEIAAWRYISRANLNRELSAGPDVYTPWFRLEWQRIEQDFREQIDGL